jgi:hypothetical protein
MAADRTPIDRLSILGVDFLLLSSGAVRARVCLRRAVRVAPLAHTLFADFKFVSVVASLTGKGVAVIQAVNKRGKGHFEQEDIHVLESLAARCLIVCLLKLLPSFLRCAWSGVCCCPADLASMRSPRSLRLPNRHGLLPRRDAELSVSKTHAPVFG